jgi:hypothetical protein
VTPEQWATIGASCVVIVGGFVAWVRWARPFARAVKTDIVSGRDALLGRDEVLDSITGKVLAPALPGMGVRMDRNETQMAAVVDAVAQIAPALTQLAESHRRLDDHETRITDNARQITDLKNAYVERIVSRADSAAAFRAIEAVASSGDDTEEKK